MSWEFGASIVAGLAAVTADLRTRMIPNWIPALAAAAGFALHTLQGGWSGLGRSLVGGVLGFGIFLVFYLAGGLGGGDIKLMAAFGTMLGPARLWTAAWWVAVCGALLAMVVLLTIRLQGRPARRVSIPYAPAICAGVWITLAG